jgi:hypothetical protein
MKNEIMDRVADVMCGKKSMEILNSRFVHLSEEYLEGVNDLMENRIPKPAQIGEQIILDAVELYKKIIDKQVILTDKEICYITDAYCINLVSLQLASKGLVKFDLKNNKWSVKGCQKTKAKRL